MDNEPDWTLILERLYHGEQKQIQKQKDPHDDTIITTDEIYEGYDLNYTEIDNILEYLDTAGLIQETDKYSDEYVLTPRGFQVIHDRVMMEKKEEYEDKRMEEREKQEDRRIQSQNEVNSAVGYLTLGLLFVTFAHTVVIAMIEKGAGVFVLSILLVVESIIIVGISLLLSRTGLLDPTTVMD